MAEGVGFEPTEPFGSPVFKTGAIDHSTTPPFFAAGRSDTKSANPAAGFTQGSRGMASVDEAH